MNIFTALKTAALTALLFMLAATFQPVSAQEEGLDETENVACEPENMTTPYDAFADESVTMDQIRIWYDYGREYYKKAQYGKSEDNYSKALPYFWKVVVNDQTGAFKVVYGKIVDCYLNLNQPDSAMLATYRGLKLYPDYPSLHYHAGYLQKNKGNINCAILHYEALVSDETQDPDALKNYYMVLSQLYLQLEDERAIDAQRKVIEYDPENVEAATTLARMMDFFGMDPLKAREEAFLKDTTNVLNARQYGMIAFESGQYDKALRAFNAVLVQEPENVEAFSYIGRVYESKDQLSNAINVYKKIITIDPDRLNTLCALASVYGRLNEFSVARSYVRRAINKDAGYGLAYMVMGEIYENAVMNCSNKREKDGYSYDDKLVFEMAREEYRKAASKDRNVASSAQNRFNQLAPFIRTKADKHMQGNRDTLKDGCYAWINPNL